MIKKQEKIWVANFKSFITSKGLDDKLPDFIVDYLDNIMMAFSKKTASLINQTEVQQKEIALMAKQFEGYMKRIAALEIEIEKTKTNVYESREMEIGGAVSGGMQ